MAKRLIDSLKNSSLKNKIFFSTTAVILLISVLIALFTRWVLISSLTSELHERGLGISHSIAESCRGYILTADIPNLTSLIFDARLGGRKDLVGYVFIVDKQNRILAHTFTRDFPGKLLHVNLLPSDKSHAIQMLRLEGRVIYDVATPVNEGIYRIGSVHVGLNKRHIDKLIGKLRTTFLGFVSAVIILFFLISHRLSRYITRPIAKLTKVSDEISRGNFNFQRDLGGDIESWRMEARERDDSPGREDGAPGGGFPETAEMDPESAVSRVGVKDEVRQLASSFINMTNRIKESQARLQDSEGKYRSLFAGGPNPIFVLDRETMRILDANPSAEETYGYPREELIGRPCADLGPFDLEEARRADFETWGAGKDISVDAKVQCRKKGGDPFYVNVHVCPAIYQEKEALILAAADITEMVEKDSQLIQASKMTTLGEMSAGIAHELNQPLNAIKMGSEFLEMMIEREEKIPQKDLFHIVGEISGQVDRAVDIIQRLRDFGRKADFTKEKIHINSPVKGVLEIIGRQLRLQNVEVRLDLDDAIPPILAHHNRLEQVIFNLLTNARDAINQKMEAGGGDGDGNYISIKSYSREGRVMVSVSDTGGGVDAAVKERIFEAFFTTKEMGEGMGLGLSITSGIVEDYGGEIHIESEEGRGAVFRLSFPAAV
ncbi:MAG: PAS domain S-box protein [Desulfobacterales bacterium]|nr:PAS domain S-box protein [Desulfobacterales bacterium]